MRRELLDHIELRTAELIDAGWTPVTARAEAERAFGDLGRVSAECREITVKSRKSHRRVERLDGLIQDLRFAIRLLRRSPTFAIMAIATLALGVGANSAIFSLINGVLLRPLPYDHPGQLADVIELHKKGWARLSYTNFADLQRQSTSFASLAAYYDGPSTLLGGDQPMRVNTAWVSGDFFRTLRVRPELGRLTTPADHHLGAPPVVVVSDRFWRNHLGATTDLASVHLRGEFSVQVVGVLSGRIRLSRRGRCLATARTRRTPHLAYLARSLRDRSAQGGRHAGRGESRTRCGHAPHR